MYLKIATLLLWSIAIICAELNQKQFQEEALMAHNLYRSIHGAPKLILNLDLSHLALTRAQELAESSEINVKQNVYNGQNLGESIGSVSGFDNYNGVSATQLWYSVVSKFDEEGEDSVEGASFSQIVWKSTKEVGFGIVLGKDNKYYFVAEYYPSGNIRGQYEENVFQVNEEFVKEQGLPLSKNSTHIVEPKSTETVINEGNNLRNSTNITTVDGVTSVLEFEDKNITIKNKIAETITKTSINMTTSTSKPKKLKLFKNKIKLTASTVSNIALSKEP